MRALTATVIEICDRALEGLGPGPEREEVAAVRSRMLEPLRVAVAGRVSAGKSTLVNALLGKSVTPTAAGETTRVVSWFRYGFPERAELELRDGRTQPVPLIEGALPDELGVDPAEARKLTVWLSNDALERMTVVDTPGLSSANERFSTTTEELLGLDSRTAVSQADALIYVTTHRARGDDADALASFRSQSGGAQASAMNAVAVLNKADMIGSARDDPLVVAARIAGEAAGELRSLATTVIPMTALWAETAVAALTESDARQLRELSRLEPAARRAMLRSVGHFHRTESSVEPAARERLLDLLGLPGISRCLEWIDGGEDSAAELAGALRRSSGIDGLRRVLEETFAVRADALKGDMGVGSLERVSYMSAHAGVLAELRAELDDVRLDPEMHRLNEAWALREVASGDATLPADLYEDLHRVALAGSVEEKLGVSVPAPADGLQRAAADGAARWRGFVNGGRSTPAQARVGEVACRSYEALWEEVAAGDAAGAR